MNDRARTLDLGTRDWQGAAIVRCGMSRGKGRTCGAWLARITVDDGVVTARPSDYVDVPEDRLAFFCPRHNQVDITASEIRDQMRRNAGKTRPLVARSRPVDI